MKLYVNIQWDSLKRVFRLLFICLFFFTAQQVVAQNQKISLSGTSITLRTAFSEIEKQTNMSVDYDETILNLNKQIASKISGKPLNEVMDLLLKDTGCGYVVKNGHIVISVKSKKSDKPAQILTGKVTDAKGETIIGANVVEKGTTNGVITDMDGNYSLSVPGNAVVTISYIGYLSKDVQVGGKNIINVVLSEDTQALDEVVIVSYGTQKKRELTGSINTVKAEALSDLPVGQIAQKLQGQIPGVQISQSSGIPGQGMAFRIRGAASINNSSQPLFVVDGMPISTGLNNLNPDEIETFTVLKDAAATSLYGSRAANGVILITTKRGKMGKTEVTLSANYGIQSIGGMKELDMMNGNEFAQFKKEFYEDRARYEGYTGGVPEMYQHPEQYGEGTNWYKELTGTAPIQNYSLSLSAGKDNFNSSVVLGYFKQDGVVMNSGFERYNLRANNDYKVNDRIRIGLDIAPMIQLYKNQNTDGQRQVLSAALSADPCQSPYDKNGDLTISLVSPGMFGQPNWIRYMNERIDQFRIITLLANAFAEVKIWDGLQYKFQIGVDLANRNHRTWTPSTSSGSWSVAPPGLARGSYDNEMYYTWTAENMLSYQKKIADHNFDILAGYSAQKYSREWGNLNGTDFPDDQITWLNAAATKNGDSGITQWTLVSMIGRLNYNYKDRYFLQANVRRDGCSRFGQGNKYATFPSASAGWIVSDEAFMEPLTSVMNYAKLRASYGVTGNYNIGDYEHLATVGDGNYVLGDALAPGKGQNGIGNSGLTWEETSQYDLGIDLGFLNDRIYFMYDYYRKTTKGMLYQIDIPWSTGFDNIKSNIGNFKSWGHEFSVESRNLTGEFKWKTNLNVTINRNEVMSLGTNDTPVGGYGNVEDWNRLQVGQPIGVFMGYVFDGVYMNEEEFKAQPKHATSAVGTARMKDLNGDKVIDIYDREIIGNPNPDFQFGITNEFSWKNFDLSILLNGQIGGDLMLGAYENALNLDGVFNVLRDVKDRWRSPENPGNGRIPRTMNGTTELYRFNHSDMVYDASYLAIKNITLGYAIPIKPNPYISKARVYFAAQQVAVFSSYPGLNPEASNNNELSWRGMGVDRTSYPIPRTFSIGCNITF